MSADEKKIICADRPSCEITAVTDAGKGAQGEDLRIADILLGLKDISSDYPEEGCRSTEAAQEDDSKVDGGREIWLLDGNKHPLKLRSLCNDGYGSAMMGSDDISIADNQLIHSEYGGSAWRWSTSTTFRLSPLAIIVESDCSYHNASPNTGELTFVDRTSMEVRSYAPAPRADWSDAMIGCPDIGVDFAKPLTPQPDADTVAAYAVPMPFEADPSPLPEGTTLGTCGLDLKSDGSKGFVIFGQPAAAGDAAEMRVIAETSRSLLIQVRDPLADAASKPAQNLSWVKQPHVEIWTANEGELDAVDSEQGPEVHYAQIGIALDGVVNVGSGKPRELPKVISWRGRDEQGRDVTVLRVTWDDEAALIYGLGVVYSQAAGGKQLRLVANAPIKKNRPLFLPNVWHNLKDESDASSAMCAFSGNGHPLDL